MKLSYSISGVAVAVFGLALVATPALACPPKASPTPTPCSSCPTPAPQAQNWTSLNTSQHQWTAGAAQPTSMTQKVFTDVKAFVGNSAVAQSQNAGVQHIDGTLSGAHQRQTVTSGAMVQFQPTQWPSWTTARTQGSVSQKQDATGTPVHMWQRAGTDQDTNIGGSGTSVKGDLFQDLTTRAVDPHQQQNLSGSSQAQGFSNPPWPGLVTQGSNFIRWVLDLGVTTVSSF